MKSYFDNINTRDRIVGSLSSVVDGFTEQEKIECLVAVMIESLGLDMDSEELEDTPYRISKMYSKELFSSLKEKPDFELTSFKSEYNHYISMENIRYFSTCSHHFMPFFGEVNIAYFPSEKDSKILGLSKFPRIVKWLSKKPQTQEEFTKNIADFIMKELKPKGIFIRVTGKHTCVSARGIEEKDSNVTTQVMLGEIDKNEVLQMWNRG